MSTMARIRQALRCRLVQRRHNSSAGAPPADDAVLPLIVPLQAAGLDIYQPIRVAIEGVVEVTT